MKNMAWYGRALETGLVLGSIAVTLLGCGDREPKPARLDVATTPPPPDLEPETERLRRLQSLHQITIDAAGNKTEADVSSFSVTTKAAYDCNVRLPTPTSADSCVSTFYAYLRSVCQARTMLAIATPQSEAIRLTDTNGTQWIYDRVTEPAAASAASYATRIVSNLFGNIMVTPLSNPNPSNPCRDASGLWRVETEGTALQFATLAVEAYNLGRAAYDRTVEATVSAADKLASGTGSETLAAQRGVAGSELSRSAAAHILVGGDAGLLGSTTQGFCATPELTPQARSALQLLRDAAPPPTTLAGTGTTSALLNTGTDSVRNRLGTFYSIDSLLATTGGESVEAHYRLSTADFDAARAYLNQELTAFSRSQSARFSPFGTSTIRRYAGAYGKVRPLPAAAWSARARYMSATPPYYSSAVGEWDYEWQETDNPPFPLDTFIGNAHSTIRLLTADPPSYAPAGGNAALTKQQVLGTLGSILTSGEYKGAIELNISTSVLHVFAMGYTAADKVRLVAGEDGLRCAVEGQVEGASCADPATPPAFPCTGDPTLSCLTVYKMSNEVPWGSMGTYGVTGYVTLPTGTVVASGNITNLANSKTRLYVVKLKSSTLAEKPGNFEVLAGIVLPPPTTTLQINAFPIVPALDARVAQVLAPSRTSCAGQEYDCTGISADSPIPLENELTADSTDVESSWRHYLDLATQAAQESDLLGAELRSAKLNSLQAEAAQQLRQEEQQQNAENVLQEVQAACGTAIDPKRLLTLLSTPATGATQPDLAGVTGGACPCTAYPGMSCVAGICVTDFAALLAKYPTDPDVIRLANCLDDKLPAPNTTPSPNAPLPATLPFVTAGNQRLCVYTTAGNFNEVCPAAVGSNACPAVKTTATCPTISGTDFYEAEPLSFFTDTPSDGVQGTCALLRLVRTSHSKLDLQKIVASDGLHHVRLRDKVGKLGFVAKLGNHLSLTEDGIERWSSGNITAGASTTWPNTKASNCPAGSKGLFCSTLTDAGTTPYAVVNRIYQAAVGAEYLRTGRFPELTHPTTFNFDLSISGRSWRGDACAMGGEKRTIYEPAPSNAPINLCVKSMDPSETGVSGFTSYTYPNVTFITGWTRPDGVNLSVTPATLINFVSTVGGGQLQPSVPLSDSMLFGGLSNSNLAWHADNMWMKRALLNEVPEDQWPRLFAFDTRQDAEIGNLGLVFSSRALVDGLELLCELSEAHGAALGTTPPAPLATLEDVDRAGNYVKSLGEGILKRASSLVFARFPKIAHDALGDVAPTGVFPALGGRMAEQVVALRQGLVAVREALPVVAGALQQMGAEMQSFRAVMDRLATENTIIDYKLLSSTLDRLNSCAQSLKITSAFDSMSVSQVSECANSAAQIGIAMQISSLEKRASNDSAEIARASFAERVSQISQTLQTAALGLQDSSERINGALAAIASLRDQARLNLAKAVHIGSYQSEKQVAYNKAAGALTALAQVRYNNALKSARKMAYLAKRAIEQRLAIRLADMREKLPLVDAPYTWEGTLCSLGGTDEASMNFPGSTSPASGVDDVAKYGDAFIGDYVKKLANVVESYSLAYNFHEGDDIAVVSLRDDVKNIRKSCSLQGQNLLRSSAELNDEGVWGATNCTATPASDCISALPIVDTTTRFPEWVLGTDVTSQGGSIRNSAPDNVSAAAGFKLQFGNGGTCTCTWQPNAAVSQVVNLGPGRYRFSWYTKDSTTGAALVSIAKTRAISGAPATTLVPTGECNTPCGSGACANGCFSFPLNTGTWKRASMEFKVPAPGGAYEVGFGVPDATRPTYAVTIGAPMLERILEAKPTALPAFQATNLEGKMTFDDCEDTGGELFRANSWKRQCVHLCDTGFSSDCATGPEYCYRELSFGVSQPWIQNGKLFKFSGFARGNFNYRIDSVGLNFVGSSVRDCTDSLTPSTCFNAGFVPYSVEHNGPFNVRNHAGANYEARLFDGRIEHARGLALERYLTNPLSETDRALITDYMRYELRGRPLDGNFVLRVWEEPGVDFDAVEDVQMILKYHYWTPSN